VRLILSALAALLLAACASPASPEIEPFRLSECVPLIDPVRQARLVELASYQTRDPARFETAFFECPDTYEIRTAPRAGGTTVVHEIDKATGAVTVVERAADRS
jgi:hypothetical protein